MTVGEALTVPVFESIDENGVDLTTGMLRLQSPTFNFGGKVSFGLEWTGRSWRYIGFPSIARDGSTYYVSDGTSTEEFKNSSNAFAQKKPINGSSLSCSVFTPQNLVSYCEYTNRLGEIIVFRGQATPYFPVPGNYGQQTMAMGNLGMYKADRYSGLNGSAAFNTNGQNYNKRDNYISLRDQELKITTPNQDGTDNDENWLRPKSTIQSITDTSGAVWSYTINSDRQLVTMQLPGGLAAITYGYNSSNRVTSVNSAAGTWTYSYSTLGNYRLVTVQTPTGRTYSVKSHLDHGYVVEHRENLNMSTERLTQYDFDTDHRLIRIIYPELNKVEFQHDGRGNVTQKQVFPTPTVGGSVLTTSANYNATCSNRVLCNRPNYVIDPNGNRTDFEYAPPETRQVILGTGILTFVERDYGHGMPVRIKHPAAGVGAPRAIVENLYVRNQVRETRNCITYEVCAGTSDEVITKIDHFPISFNAKLSMRNISVISPDPLHESSILVPYSTQVIANGQTLRTCLEYDENGRLVGQTPPRAGLTSCPTTLSVPAAYNATTPSPNYPRATPSFSQ